MAHAFHGSKAKFFYNSDFSGEITIITNPLEHAEERAEFKVDAQDILDLVAEHIRSELIGSIEQMGTKDLLTKLYLK